MMTPHTDTNAWDASFHTLPPEAAAVVGSNCEMIIGC